MIKINTDLSIREPVDNLYTDAARIIGVEDYIIPNTEHFRRRKNILRITNDSENRNYYSTTRIWEDQEAMLKRTIEKGKDIINNNLLLTNIVKIIGNEIKQSIKYKFGFELQLSPDTPSYKKVINWIKKHDNKWNNHCTKMYEEDVLMNIQFFVRVRKDTYVLVQVGSFTINDEKELLYSTYMSPKNIRLYIFGKKSPKIYREIKNILDDDDRTLTCYKIVAGNSRDTTYTAMCSPLIRRKFDTIFFENGVIDSLKHHIDNFLSTQPIYKARNIIYKTGILLEGEPGTGKTSLATAIASEYDCDLYIIGMEDFKNFKISKLSDGINNMNTKMKVILLEDIDCIVSDRESENISQEDKENINKLLQFIDSSISPTNIIFVATTNYPERLDDAITRAGRFDSIININGLHEKRAIDMCKSFNLNDDVIKDILNEMKTKKSYEKYGNFNQAELQAEILNHIEIKSEIHG